DRNVTGVQTCALPIWACWLVAALKFHTDCSHIETARDLVLHKGVAVILSFCVIHYILEKRHADSLRDTALCLHTRQTRIHHGSKIGRASCRNRSKIIV